MFLNSLTKDEKIRLTQAENINVFDEGDYIILESENNEKKERKEERSYKFILDKYYKYWYFNFISVLGNNNLLFALDNL